MYLKTLDISGFKSFGKKGHLEFKTPITSIVGPNGSGKSNVAEAFRFVLGEQSQKRMRGKSTSDLIFNGSRTAGRANRASTKVIFDNSQKLLNIDYDEVIIERVIHRDGAGEYRINGSKVRLRDVIEILAGANIGASGHHIISQGEADRILSVNSRERKTMIEDALGLKIYQYKKDEAKRRLEKTEENMKEVEMLRREIKPHLAFLTRQVKKIERTQELRDELLTLYKTFFRDEEVYIRETKRDIREKREPRERRNEELRVKLDEAKRVLESQSAENEKAGEVLELERTLSEVRSEKDTLVRDAGRVEGEIGVLERQIAREAKRREEGAVEQVPFKDVKSLIDDVERDLGEVESLTDLELVKERLATLRDVVKGFIQRIISGSTQEESESMQHARQDLTARRGEKDELQKKVADAEHREREYNDAYLRMKKTIEDERSTSREAERAIFKLTTEHNELRMELNTLRAREDSLKLIEDEYLRERDEAVALVGEEALSYSTEGVEVPTASAREDDRVKQNEKKRTVERMKIRLEEAGAGSGEEVLKEYQETLERDQFLERELVDLEHSAQSLHELIVELDQKLSEEFKAGVKKINTEFSRFFALMFGGGTASLQVVKEKPRKRKDTDIDEVPEEPMSEEDEQDLPEGVEITVSLPRKKLRGLHMLSGGERALTSIALIFAMSQVNPPPFLILDETDAALDEANSKRYGDMIENLAQKSQLILITHNRETMSRAGVLYGITMGADGISQLLSVEFDEAVQVAK